MSQTAPQPELTSQEGPRAIVVPEGLRVSAAERLVSGPDRQRAAIQLIANAPAHGIDLRLIWGVQGTHQGVRLIRQTVMGVPSAGKTGMLFLSPPRAESRFGTSGEQTQELVACLRAANAGLPTASEMPVRICQALIEPEHTWAERACQEAGMTWVGRLQFLRKRWSSNSSEFKSQKSWPAGVRVVRVKDPLDFGPDGSGRSLELALDGSYNDTLDCPELCGLRPTRDVIASHMATGSFDPKRWWLLHVNGEPAGCCLLNHCPSTASVELVYLGLAPRARGMGVGIRLLEHALAHLDVKGVREITCAVDTRNEPALKLYRSLGFRPFSARVGFVHVSSDKLIELKAQRVASPANELPSVAVETKPNAPVPASPFRGEAGTSRGQEKVRDAKRL